MADNKPIQVIIRDERAADMQGDGSGALVLPGADGTIPTQDLPTAGRKTASVKGGALSAAGAVGIFAGAKVANFASSRIQAITGSARAQAQSDLLLKGVGLFAPLALATTPLAATVVVASIATELATTAFDYNQKRRFEVIQENEARRRLNLSSTNGSRNR